MRGFLPISANFSFILCKYFIFTQYIVDKLIPFFPSISRNRPKNRLQIAEPEATRAESQYDFGMIDLRLVQMIREHLRPANATLLRRAEDDRQKRWFRMRSDSGAAGAGYLVDAAQTRRGAGSETPSFCSIARNVRYPAPAGRSIRRYPGRRPRRFQAKRGSDGPNNRRSLRRHRNSSASATGLPSRRNLNEPRGLRASAFP